ncbi:MAG TPA: hypothetical protein VGI54_01190 [Solirubrobacteraceae bacterium]
MPSGPTLYALERVTGRVPGLRRIPAVRLLALGEIALLARNHVGKLTPAERRRLVELVRHGHGRPRNLSQDERNELSRLLAKAEPRHFAGLAAAKLSPVPLPRRVVEGPRRSRKRPA